MGSLLETPLGNMVVGHPAKVVKTGKGEKLRIEPERELIDQMEQRQLAERAGRLFTRRKERGLKKLSNTNLYPVLNEAKTALLAKYGFEPVSIARMGPNSEMRLMTKLASKIIERNNSERERVHIGLSHEMDAFSELGFIVTSMDAMRGKKFGDQVANIIVEEYERHSRVGSEMSPILRITFDSIRGRLTMDQARKFLDKEHGSLGRGEAWSVDSMLPQIAISGVDIAKLRKDLDPTSAFLNNVFQRRFKEAAQSPVFNGPQREMYGSLLKTALETVEQMKRDEIPEHFYQGQMRGWLLYSLAMGIARSGGTKTRII